MPPWTVTKGALTVDFVMSGSSQLRPIYKMNGPAVAGETGGP